MATRLRPRWAAVAVVFVLAACGKSDFGDFAQATTTIAGSQPSVTLGGSPTSEPSASSTTTTIPASSQPTTTVAPSATTRPAGPLSTPPTAPVVTGARTDATAANLAAAPRCEGGFPVIRLTWEPVGNAEQVVAVSSRPDGLDSGNFTSSETLPASRASYDLREAQAGAISYWRVLTKRGTGFAASETSQFQGPLCTTS